MKDAKESAASACSSAFGEEDYVPVIHPTLGPLTDDEFRYIRQVPVERSGPNAIPEYTQERLDGIRAYLRRRDEMRHETAKRRHACSVEDHPASSHHADI